MEQSNDPFKQKSFVDLVTNDIKNAGIGETTQANLYGEDKSKYRMTLKYVSGKLGMKFKTKTSLDGNLWIKRVA